MQRDTLKRWNELNILLDGVLNQIESQSFYSLTAADQQKLIDRMHKIGHEMNRVIGIVQPSYIKYS